MEDARIEQIEKMLQVMLDAICSLAKELTGKSMIIGHFDDDGHDFGAGPRSEHIKWAE
jgi:hypothetical protein